MVTTYHNKIFLVVAGGLALGALTACSEGMGSNTTGLGGSGGSGSTSTSTTTTTTTTATSSTTTTSSSSGMMFTQVWTFDTGLQGWAIVDASDINPAMSADMQAANVAALKANSTLEIDTTEGDPTAGSIK